VGGILPIFYDFLGNDVLIEIIKIEVIHTSHLLQVCHPSNLCVLGAMRVEHLGHLVTASGICPLPARVATIKDFPKPSTVKEPQTFLAMLNCNRHFIAGAARLLKPLTGALHAE